MYKEQIYIKKEKKYRELSKIRRHIPMNLVSCSALSSPLESKTLFFMVGSSSGSSRTSSNPSKDTSASGPHVAELGMEKMVTTKEGPSFTA